MRVVGPSQIDRLERAFARRSRDGDEIYVLPSLPQHYRFVSEGAAPTTRAESNMVIGPSRLRTMPFGGRSEQVTKT